jgi:hypothetical protein
VSLCLSSTFLLVLSLPCLSPSSWQLLPQCLSPLNLARCFVWGNLGPAENKNTEYLFIFLSFFWPWALRGDLFLAFRKRYSDNKNRSIPAGNEAPIVRKPAPGERQNSKGIVRKRFAAVKQSFPSKAANRIIIVNH